MKKEGSRLTSIQEALSVASECVYRGLGTALLTPFSADGALDLPALRRFVEWQIAEGVQFLVPCGTTGETPTLTQTEQEQVIENVLDQAGGRVPLLVGCGGNNTAALIEKGRRFAALGVTHILSVSPYYNKPTEKGLLEHYRALRGETGLQVLLYSVQGRTGSNVSAEVVAQLAEEGVIFGVKEASASIAQMQQIGLLCAEAIERGDFVMLSGDDAMTLPCTAVGGRGVISVASNVIPRAMRRWVDRQMQGDFLAARGQLKHLLPLFSALFLESNPVPVKAAAHALEKMTLTYRLPLVPPSESVRRRVENALAAVPV